MSTQFLIARDISGGILDTNSALPCAIDGFSGELAATVEQHWTVPANYKYWLAVMSAQEGKNVYFDGITTAAVPSSTLSATTMERIPTIGLTRYVKAGQTLSFITGDSGGSTLTVKLYVANTYQNVD